MPSFRSAGILFSLSLTLLFLIACDGKAEKKPDPRADVIRSWLEGRKLLRHGGNGKIDASIRAVAITALPNPAGDGWTKEKYLVVWVRFEQLDSSWTWTPDEQPAFATIEARPGGDLAPAEPGLRDSAGIHRLLGGQIPPEKLEVGDYYSHVQIFPLPPEDAQELVVRTQTRLPSDEEKLLVPVLVKTADLPRTTWGD
jgi:hypothetical protein